MVRLDDLHTAPVNAQCLANHAAHNVRDLGGADHLNAVAFHLREADKVLNVTVLHGWRAVPALHLDEARPLMASS